MQGPIAAMLLEFICRARKRLAALSAPIIQSFAALRAEAAQVGAKRIAVVSADNVIALIAARDAAELGLAVPILLGDRERIQNVASKAGLDEFLQDTDVVDCRRPEDIAVEMARDGEIDAILKGGIRTDELLHAVLDGDVGLRTGRLLSDVLLYEDTLSGARRLVGITDGGLNVSPDLAQKRQIIENAIDVFHCLGIVRPKIAVMSATETVNRNMASTIDAAELTRLSQEGVFGCAEVYGPLALDNALLISAAQTKGINNPVAGRADCMIMPCIEAGNLLGKAVKYLGGSGCAHIVVGAKIPVLIPSRVENAEDKVNAIALGVLYGSHKVLNFDR